MSFSSGFGSLYFFMDLAKTSAITWIFEVLGSASSSYSTIAVEIQSKAEL